MRDRNTIADYPPRVPRIAMLLHRVSRLSCDSTMLRGRTEGFHRTVERNAIQRDS